jgi:hypothetical protein
VQSRRHTRTNAYQAHDLKQIEERSRAQIFKRRATRHRLTWFETLQGLSFLAFVMLGKANSFLSGCIVCGGIAMCIPAMIATGMRGRARNPLHLVLATFWALIGTVYILLRMS